MTRLALLSAALLAACAHRPVAPPTADELIALETPSRARPAFPPDCRRLGRIAFVAIGPLKTLDVEALAERYRRVYGVEIEVLPSLPAAALTPAWDAQRRQHRGGQVLTTLAQAFAPHATPPRWIIGVTDGDLYWEQRDWRFSFSLRGGAVAVVSTARTEPGRPRSAARTMKLISRALGETYCGLERGGPDDSVLRPTLMSLTELDAIDEAVWTRGPTWL